MIVHIKESVLSFPFVRQEFEDVGECLALDLSAIKVSLTRDVHTDSYDIEICIYGQEDIPDSPPVIHHRCAGTSSIQPLKACGGVPPYRVLSLFDQDLLDLFTDKGMMIRWNHGDLTARDIDPVLHKNIGLLFAQEQ
ncbi:hypothetical protein [Desulfocicer niacini]